MVYPLFEFRGFVRDGVRRSPGLYPVAILTAPSPCCFGSRGSFTVRQLFSNSFTISRRVRSARDPRPCGSGSRRFLAALTVIKPLRPPPPGVFRFLCSFTVRCDLRRRFRGSVTLPAPPVTLSGSRIAPVKEKFFGTFCPIFALHPAAVILPR